MADKTTTELERVYTIPLRKTKDLVRSRRADLAVRDVKRFLSRHMKSDDIWVDNEVNEHLWARGKFTIPSRIRVRATRFSDGVVEVTLPEVTHTGSVRTEIQERREKAAEHTILKAPEPEADETAEAGSAERPVTDVKGVGPATAEKLEHAGIKTLEDLSKADPANVAEATSHSADKAKAWIEDAKAILAGSVETADKKVQPELAAEAAKAEAPAKGKDAPETKE
jgi:large subunit ribosomal protein L31e